MERLRLYNVFHLNLAFSSIEERLRPEVVSRCYWPLLRLARQVPLGIEATGYTLEAIETIDSTWVDELRRLSQSGCCEFIGSGYAQLIGPLVPPRVTAANLELGHEVYERMIGRRPTVALINEQSFSSGIIQLYVNAGYEAIVMEWDNAASRQSWPASHGYLPQIACDGQGGEIPVIWNHTIGFQKLQRFVYGELDSDEYYDYVLSHASSSPRAFSLYGSDAEVFDFRPGRYAIEEACELGEWDKLQGMFLSLLEDPNFEMILPSEVASIDVPRESHNRLVVDSAAVPIPVKKQAKYNATRWAVSGRNDTAINTACWRIYEMLASNGWPKSRVKELCYLWSSDFRTHITADRWQEYCRRLKTLETQVSAEGGRVRAQNVELVSANQTQLPAGVSRKGRFLEIELPNIRLRLNCRRGLAIEELTMPSLCHEPVVRTLPHGFFTDIGWAADFYSGHFVFQAPGQAKVTDLQPVEPAVTERDGQLEIVCSQDVANGQIRKSLVVSNDPPSVELNYYVDWEHVPSGSLRLGHVTLNPAAFCSRSLYYETANGGEAAQRYFVGEQEFDHGRSVSFLVSAAQAIGATNGRVDLGDANRRVRVEFDHSLAALVGLIAYQPFENDYFYRLSFSAREVDDTSCEDLPDAVPFPRHFRMRIAA